MALWQPAPVTVFKIQLLVIQGVVFTSTKIMKAFLPFADDPLLVCLHAVSWNHERLLSGVMALPPA